MNGISFGIYNKAHSTASRKEQKKRAIFDQAEKPSGISPRLRDMILPQFSIQVPGKGTYHVSDLFTYAGRDVRVIYAEYQGKIHLQFAYESRSQGIWRIAPWGNKDFFGKGISLSEADVALPIDFTLKMQPILDEPTPLFEDEAEQLFYPQDPTEKDYDKAMKGKKCDLLCSQPQVVARAIPNQFRRNGEVRRYHWIPSELKIQGEENQPDFTKQETHYFYTSSYPNAIARKIPSKDGKLQYLFIERNGKTFIAAVEKTDCGITKYGTNAEYVEGEDLTLPLWEYEFQCPQIIGPKKMKGAYLSTWEYLKNIPLIIRYQTLAS